MRTLILTIPILMMALGCQARSTDTGAACRASLAALNTSEIEQVLIVREVDGHNGYSLVVSDCEYFVPLSISSMRENERVSLNRTIQELFKNSPDQRGVGFFDAQCKCTFDPNTGVVSASAAFGITPYTGPELLAP